MLVARDADRLRRTADDLAHRFGGDVEVLAADLSHPEACATVEERLADRDRPVDLLVNNAGFSVNQPFVTGDLAAEQLALDVMVRAVVRLSHAALGAMVTRGTGAVINVSSVAGWMPSGTYGAAKAYVISFTEGLAGELKGTGVHAMVVLPRLHPHRVPRAGRPGHVVDAGLDVARRRPRGRRLVAGPREGPRRQRALGDLQGAVARRAARATRRPERWLPPLPAALTTPRLSGSRRP